MEWTPPQNGRYFLAEKDLAVDTAWQEEKRKIAKIMEEPSDGLHEKQKHGRIYGRRQTSMAFGNEQTFLNCIDPNNNNNNSHYYYYSKKNIKKLSLDYVIYKQLD